MCVCEIVDGYFQEVEFRMMFCLCVFSPYMYFDKELKVLQIGFTLGLECHEWWWYICEGNKNIIVSSHIHTLTHTHYTWGLVYSYWMYVVELGYSSFYKTSTFHYPRFHANENMYFKFCCLDKNKCACMSVLRRISIYFYFFCLFLNVYCERNR